MKFDSRAFLKLVQCFIPLKTGYMYTPSEGCQEAVAIETTLSRRYDVNAQLAFSMKQAGVGLSKEVAKNWRVGVGVASKYTKFEPEVYASIMREWKF